jgi:hypothetical protein
VTAGAMRRQEEVMVIGAAGALAALDLLRIDDIVGVPVINGMHFTPLIDAVRSYIIRSLETGS